MILPGPISPRSFSKSLDASGSIYNHNIPTSVSAPVDLFKGSHYGRNRLSSTPKMDGVEKTDCDGFDTITRKSAASVIGSLSFKIEGVSTIVVVGGTVGAILAAKSLSKLKRSRVVYVDTKDFLELTQGVMQHIFEKDKVKLQQNLRDFRVPYSQIFHNTGVIFINSEVIALTSEKVLFSSTSPTLHSLRFSLLRSNPFAYFVKYWMPAHGSLPII